MGRSQAQQNYEASYDAYNRALEDYKATAEKEYQNAYAESKGYTGDEGYKRSLNKSRSVAQQLAGSAASTATAQATGAARSAGMSRSQAAALGANQAINAYGDTLNNQLAAQQALAYQSGTDRTNAAYQKAGGISETYGNALSGRGNQMSTSQAEAQNQYNRTWGNIGGVGSLLLSDERSKDYVPTDEMVAYLQNHGLSRGKDDKEFDARQLAAGILVEIEHSPDFNVALEIAKDHLVEDPEYYSNPMFKREAVKSILDFKVDLSKYKKEN